MGDDWGDVPEIGMVCNSGIYTEILFVSVRSSLIYCVVYYKNCNHFNIFNSIIISHFS